MAAIKPHKTAVDKTGSWDGPKAVADAPADKAVLMYMHAWVDGKGDPERKSSYKFPHHLPGTDTPAVIKGVNNALSRLPQANIPAGDRTGVEAHLRKHRKDAGLEESMSETEIGESVKHFKEVNDLKAPETQVLLEAVRLQEKTAGSVPLQEAANMGDWMEAQLHQRFVGMIDDQFGSGYLTKAERDALLPVAEQAMTVFRTGMDTNCPDMVNRAPWQQAQTAISETVEENGHSAVVPLRESLCGEFIPLMEKAVGQDGTIPIKLIQPGWGTSGYYPPEVLARDGSKAFPTGTKMFWNHPTRTEESDRPERDLNDLAAELTSNAQYQEKGPAGAGLYANAKVFQKYQPAVDDLAESIGLSIRAAGKATNGSAEGRKGPIISDIIPDAWNTVDFVTYPGAGGEIINLFEAARTVRADLQPATSQRGVEDQEVDMDEKELQKLQETNAALVKENSETKAEKARMQEALILREAKDMVGTILAKSALPEVTKARLVESLAKAAPIKDGKLDKEAFGKLIEETVKAEVQYLTEVAGLGNVKGLGESSDDEAEEVEGEKKIQESLEKSFTDIGLNEKSAKTAAQGRD